MVRYYATIYGHVKQSAQDVMYKDLFNWNPFLKLASWQWAPE